MQKLATLKETVSFWSTLQEKLNTLLDLIELAISDNDMDFREAAEQELSDLAVSLEQEEFKLLLSGEYDKRSAIKSKEWAIEQMRFSGAQRLMLPWLHDEIEEMQHLMGSNTWAYGVEPNRGTLETFMKYLVDQQSHYT